MGPDLPGDGDPSGPTEPPAQLLRRAISHVESLLHRLEPAPDAGPQDDPGEADAEPGSGYVVELSRAGTAVPTAGSAEDGDAEPAVAVAGERDDGEEPPTVAERQRDEGHVPLSGVSSAAQAEALRITLNAHEEAHRLRAEANGLRAEAAAEGERVLLEARMLSDRLHEESRESATELLSAARREAAALLEAAGAEAERIRAEAADAAQAEADRLVADQVSTATAEARRIVAAGRARARELLDAVDSGAENVRGSMRDALRSLGESLAAFDAAVQGIDSLREDVREVPAERVADDDDAETRRPLGLLFGAPRS